MLACLFACLRTYLPKLVQHQASWQNIVAVLESKAHLSSFCLEVQKQLGIRYIAPPMPVNLSFRNGSVGPEAMPPLAPPVVATEDSSSSSVAAAAAAAPAAVPGEDHGHPAQQPEAESPRALGKHIAAIMQSYETKKEK